MKKYDNIDFSQLIWEFYPHICNGINICELDDLLVNFFDRIVKPIGIHSFLLFSCHPYDNSDQLFFWCSSELRKRKEAHDTKKKLLLSLNSQSSLAEERTDFRAAHGDLYTIMEHGEKVSVQVVFFQKKTTSSINADNKYLKIIFLLEEKLLQVKVQDLCVLAAFINMGFASRNKQLSHFPPKIHEESWENLCLNQRPNYFKRFDNLVECVTVSLDLRKSTLQMDLSSNGFNYADWLNKLLNVFKLLIHKHNGIYDKFIGDGIVAHFLVGENHKKALLDAIDLSHSMIIATSVFIMNLQENIRFDCKYFGAGVGIALDKSNWLFGQNTSPQVVGRGLIDACRLCSSAKAKQVLMTVNAWEKFSTFNSGYANEAKKIDFSSKEYSGKMGLQVWAFNVDTTDISPQYDSLIKLCENMLDTDISTKN